MRSFGLAISALIIQPESFILLLAIIGSALLLGLIPALSAYLASIHLGK